MSAHIVDHGFQMVVGFFAGLFVGSGFGLVLACLLLAAKNSDQAPPPTGPIGPDHPRYNPLRAMCGIPQRNHDGSES